jgi:hypothetical protein
MQPDGTIDRTQVAGGGFLRTRQSASGQMMAQDFGAAAQQGGTGGIILRKDNGTKDHHAWEFLKWWGDWETQHEFNRQVEMMMGTAGRLNTANFQTLIRQGYSKRHLDVIVQAANETYFLPLVPGNYAVMNGTINANYDVLYNHISPREAVMKQEPRINSEIAKKRAEFQANNPVLFGNE